MRSKLLHGGHGERSFAIILDSGDEAMHVLQEFAARERLGGAQLTAIGALSRAKLAFFEWETKQYRPIPVDEQVEVASLVGDIAIGPDGKPSVQYSGGMTGPHWPAICWRHMCGQRWRSSYGNRPYICARSRTPKAA